MLAAILISHHNLAFFLETMRRVREAIKRGEFGNFRRDFINKIREGEKENWNAETRRRRGVKDKSEGFIENLILFFSLFALFSPRLRVSALKTSFDGFIIRRS